MAARAFLALIFVGLVRNGGLPTVTSDDGVSQDSESLVFSEHIQPILKAHCGKCHGRGVRKADLNLLTIDGIRQGGESGPVIDPGNSKASLLFEFVHDGSMPPDGERPLNAAQIEQIRTWIESGARELVPETPFTASGPIAFSDIRPLLFRRCTMCHGPEYQFGGIDLRTRESALEGGDHGPALVAGRPDDSLMVTRVVQRSCPPQPDIGEAGIEPMTPSELATLKQWISGGASPSDRASDVASAGPDPLVSDEDRQFWSFQSPRMTTPPQLKSKQERPAAAAPIDAFLIAKLEEHGLSYSPEADKMMLARRAAFALTGLPPKPELVDEFLRDTSPGAFERLVDRLLASPSYGEKWGRFWLDLAGYSDSEGKRHADMIRPYAWKYRDWVIRAFNRDLPYDQFLIEQIAGDELVDWADEGTVNRDVVDKLIATGFLRMAPDGTSADPVNRLVDRMEVIADEIDILGRGVLGLTLNCARCHSHKYDPIPQRDYYRLVAVFKGAYDEYDWLTPQPFTNQWNKAKQRHLTLLDTEERAEISRHNRPIEERIAALQAEFDDPQTAAERKKKVQASIKSQRATLREPSRIRALWDRGRPSPTFLYRRGDENQPVAVVGPGVPSALTDKQTPFLAQPPGHSSPKTGRRLALARWLTQPDHPLTARVIVNRIWQHHFGRGIVASVDNFGRLGNEPTHPELLDWLAVDFVEHGWSIKRLHRQVMTSAVWRQSSLIRPEHQRIDPDNRLLSRMPMRRLSAEEIRDTILDVAGKLNETPFGEPDPVDVQKNGLVVSTPTGGMWRRSIYVRQRRKEMPTLFETFDLPQMAPNCTERKTSNVVTQPLLLLNNRLVYELAGHFAKRVRRMAKSDEDQVRLAFRLAFSRPPSAPELAVSLETLDGFRYQWSSAGQEEGGVFAVEERAFADLCHALLNSAGFLYVD